MKPKEALYYKTPESAKTAECKLCPHLCRIPPGKAGICTVRHNNGGVLTAESYGKITSAAVDPIEKKPFYHFYPGSMIFSIGSYGCNFRCGFCQNHRISMPSDINESSGLWRKYSPEEIAATAQDCAVSHGSIGCAYTYNEPLISYEFVADCARLIKKQGLKNVLITNGFICREPFEELLGFIDAVNIDLKSFSPVFYKEISGSPNALGGVMRTIKTSAPRCHVEITTLIIPEKNDSAEEMESLSKWLAGIREDIPLHISRFFPSHNMRDKKPTPPETVYRLADKARKNLRYVYCGNC